MLTNKGSRRASWKNALALFLVGGCGVGPLDSVKATDPTGREVGAELLYEIDQLGTIFTPRLVLYVAVIIGVAYLLRRALVWSVRIAWRLGWDTDRRLARGRSYLELGLLVVTIMLLGQAFFRVVPILSLTAITFAGLISSIALRGGLQDLAAGVALAGRHRFVEGDQIEVSGHQGPVRHIGLLRTMLRLPDGRTLWLPNREIVRSAVHVGRAQQALPVTVPLPTGADDPEYRERLRQAAHLSPYRRAGSRPSIGKDGDRWVLSFQTWATRRPHVAAAAMSRRLRELGAQEGSTP